MFGEAFNAVMAIGGVIVALILSFAAAYWKGKESGKVKAERDAFERSMEESSEFQDRLNAGHVAGNRPSGMQSHEDPYDRANRRKSR